MTTTTSFASIHTLRNAVSPDTTIFWFRRDLRLEDNGGLHQALKNHKNVLPLFIYDQIILEKLENRNDRRVEFIHLTVHGLKASLEELGSSILIAIGDPAEIFRELTPRAVIANDDYEPYARERDSKVRDILSRKGIPFYVFKDHVIFEKAEVVKDNGTPYTVFTPYSRKWKAMLNDGALKANQVEKYYHNLKPTPPLHEPTLEDIGFKPTADVFPVRQIKLSRIRSYDETRNFPGIVGTTRLGIHLRFGTVSIRRLVSIALRENPTWLNELIWREFFQMILWHFPETAQKCFKTEYERILWRNNEQEFQAWCEGRTGYPLVDAGMRELNATGFMHNRVRMVTASFLTKHLLIDWRWGEGYFAEKLLDYELASNVGGWQWAAGCGCDAAPYFRIFNPALQEKKFDPDRVYVKRWIPEVDTPSYPGPIVDHAFARERALRAYQSALSKG